MAFDQNTNEYEVSGLSGSWTTSVVCPNLPRAQRQIEHLFKEGYYEVTIKLLEKSKYAEKQRPESPSFGEPLPEEVLQAARSS